MKLLIVEDQRFPLKALDNAVRRVVPRYFPGFGYDTARSYNEASSMIPAGYEIILLDHRLPRENTGDLEDMNFEAFTEGLEEIGYSLIPGIKGLNPATVVIGTSSLSKRELGEAPSPDYTMGKSWTEAEIDLDRILAELESDS